MLANYFLYLSRWLGALSDLYACGADKGLLAERSGWFLIINTAALLIKVALSVVCLIWSFQTPPTFPCFTQFYPCLVPTLPMSLFPSYLYVCVLLPIQILVDFSPENMGLIEYRFGVVRPTQWNGLCGWHLIKAWQEIMGFICGGQWMEAKKKTKLTVLRSD